MVLPSQRAADPDTPAEELLSLAANFPGEVLGNPALPLISLSNPALFREIANTARNRHRLLQMIADLESRSLEERAGWAASCLERAAHLWENAPGLRNERYKKVVRDAIDATRAWAKHRSLGSTRDDLYHVIDLTSKAKSFFAGRLVSDACEAAYMVLCSAAQLPRIPLYHGNIGTAINLSDRIAEALVLANGCHFSNPEPWHREADINLACLLAWPRRSVER